MVPKNGYIGSNFEVSEFRLFLQGCYKTRGLLRPVDLRPWMVKDYLDPKSKQKISLLRALGYDFSYFWGLGTP